jgi:hypothetical protein
MGVSVRAAAILAVTLFAFLASDKYFTFLEDETKIVDAARQPPSQTLGLFWAGQGQHEHPPLSDILLHYWLPMGKYGPWLLRLPSVLFYLAGLLLLALAAKQLAGTSAFASMLWAGSLWPFAFHFARMTGWYAFCFFLAAAMTLSYLRYLERPDWKRLALFIAAAALMVYSNYYGWALAACFALDVCIARRKQASKFIFCTFGILISAYTPMWTVFFRQLASGAQVSGGPPLASKILNSIYCFYSLFVSESVAPWFWFLSVPACLAILSIAVSTAMLLSKRNRAFAGYFALLFGGMAAIGILNTKRLLFLSAWLLLPVSIALANREKKAVRTVLAASLALVAAVGWLGILSRGWYAAPHFIEPWAQIADEAAVSAEHGGVVVSNSPSFLFYANYALHSHGMLKGPFSPGWVEDPRIVPVAQWSGLDLSKPSTVLFVNGVNIDFPEETSRVQSWLRAHCVLVSMRQLVPDSGWPLKARFFKGAGQRQYRIELSRYKCPSAAY